MPTDTAIATPPAEIPAETTPTTTDTFLAEGPTFPAATRTTIRLCLTRRKRFRFHHGGVLHGLLCKALGHDLPPGLVLWAAESGRISYQAGDAYQFTVTLTGEARRQIAEIESALEKIATRAARRGPRRTLHGNFVLDSVDSEELVQSPRHERGRDDDIRLRFVSPLRLKRPTELQIAGGTYLDARCFPPAHFLRRLYQRWHLLAHGSYPRPEEVPNPPSELAARAGHLVWTDLPLKGKSGTKRMTLGGVMGDVTLTGLTTPWVALLDVMQSFHAGASTQYGLGRYVLSNGSGEIPQGPATRHIDAVASRGSLARALEQEARTGGAGIDEVTPEAFVAGGARRLERIADELRRGRFQPHPLRLVDGHAVPTVRDRVVQRALVEQLAPMVGALRGDRGRRDRRSLDVDDLLALLPGEPAVQLLQAFSEAPVREGRDRRERGDDLRVVSPLADLW